MSELVVLVDARNEVIGASEKLKAHREGLLHRAFSIFLIDRHGRVLLQQRAATKYHSPELWSNSCCGHPRPGESIVGAAGRRLREELGISCPLRQVSDFVYRATLGNSLVEHEIDHVLVGRYDGSPRPNSDEVQDWRWEHPRELRANLARESERYTAWLPLALEQLERLRPSLDLLALFDRSRAAAARRDR